MNKLDVLDTFPQISVGVRYLLNGVEYEGFPADLETLAKIEVIYEHFEGWLCDTRDIRQWEDLPVNARKFIGRVGELLGMGIKWVGVGPERDAMICLV
jgi:adenylosuccinate synthase